MREDAVQVLAEVVRSGFVEGHHRGAVVRIGPDGGVDWSRGDVAAPVFPRSCLKPLQAVAAVRSGLDLEPRLLALAAASHSGEPFHLEGVLEVLGAAGLGVDSLATPADLPLDETARAAYLAAGGRPAPVVMNCSGKHAAWLATCVHAGWPTDSYLDPTHPLQRAVHSTVEDLTGETVPASGVDGCGAPLHAVSLTGLARAFARIATAPEGSAEHRVGAAMAAHPEWVSGSTRPDRALAAAFPGAVAKIGAEGCYALALPTGEAYALKIDDGAARAIHVVMAEALRIAGHAHPVLDEQHELPLLGGGVRVGEVRPTLA